MRRRLVASCDAASEGGERGQSPKAPGPRRQILVFFLLFVSAPANEDSEALFVAHSTTRRQRNNPRWRRCIPHVAAPALYSWHTSLFAARSRNMARTVNVARSCCMVRNCCMARSLLLVHTNMLTHTGKVVLSLLLVHTISLVRISLSVRSLLVVRIC